MEKRVVRSGHVSNVAGWYGNSIYYSGINEALWTLSAAQKRVAKTIYIGGGAITYSATEQHFALSLRCLVST